MRPLLQSAKSPFETPLLALIGVSLGLHLLLFLLLSQGEPAIQDLPPSIEVELVDYAPLEPEPAPEAIPEPLSPPPVVKSVQVPQPRPVAPQAKAQTQAQATAKAAAAPRKPALATKPASPAAATAKQTPPAPAKPTLELRPRLEGFSLSPVLPPPSRSQGQPAPSPRQTSAKAGVAGKGTSGQIHPGPPGPAPLEPGLAAPQDTARERATLGPEEADQGYQAVEIAQPQASSSRAAQPRRPQPQVLAPGIVIEGDAAGRRVIYRPPLPRLEQHNEARITLIFVVMADGSVDQVLPLVKGDPGLENLAMEALARFRFDPAPAGAAPTRGKIHFTLKPGR